MSKLTRRQEIYSLTEDGIEVYSDPRPYRYIKIKNAGKNLVRIASSEKGLTNGFAFVVPKGKVDLPPGTNEIWARADGGQTEIEITLQR